MIKQPGKLSFAGCVLLAVMFGAIPARCQENAPERSPAEAEAAALKALIKSAVTEGKKILVPTAMNADAQDFMNAGKAGGSDVVESDPWKKKRLKPVTGLRRSDDENSMAAGMSAVGMMVDVHANAMSGLVATMPPEERAKMGGAGDNLAGLPADTPSRALRRSSSRATHVFYVLLGPGDRPLRLVWRQTHGDTAAISSRSVYYISDIDGELMDVVERGKGYQGRPAARLKNDDKDVLARFHLEKEFWLKKSKAGLKKKEPGSF